MNSSGTTLLVVVVGIGLLAYLTVRRTPSWQTSAPIVNPAANARGGSPPAGVPTAGGRSKFDAIVDTINNAFRVFESVSQAVPKTTAK